MDSREKQGEEQGANDCGILLGLDYVGVIVGEDMVVRDGRILTRPEKRSRMDKSIAAWKTLSVKDPTRTAKRIESIIKNTYRTLMTRGQKACHVYFTDMETRRYFEKRMGVVVAAPTPFVNALPLISLRAVANSEYGALDGYFAEPNSVTWQRVPGGPFPEDRFLVRAEGDSMEPLVRNGQLCIFRRDPGGSRNGKIVLCRIGGFAGDASVAVIERHRSARQHGQDTIGAASMILLSSINEKHEDIVVTNGEHLSIIGVLDHPIQD